VADLEKAQVLRVEDGNHGEYRPQPDEFVPDGVAFIRAADMADGRVMFETAESINKTARLRIRKGIGRPLDVLLSHKGTVGKVAFAPLDSPAFVCSPQTTFWRSLDHEVINPRFLLYYLLSPDFQNQLRALKGETDMADYVSLSTQRQLELELPPLDAQHSIAGLLGALDAKVEANRRLVNELHAVFAALYRRLDDGVGPRVEFGEVAVESRVKISPSRTPAAHFDLFSIPAFDTGLGPDDVLGSSVKSDKWLVKEPAVLVSKLNPLTPRIWLARPRPTLSAIASTEFAVLRPTPNFSIGFLYLVCRSSSFSRAVAALVTGTTGSHQRVRASDMQRITVRVPADDSAGTLNAFLESALELANIVANESGLLNQLRDLLLPKLISGEIRLPHLSRTGQPLL
jgi:type I restriction enzyme S subunit